MGKINPIRHFLLKIAKGVAKEEAWIELPKKQIIRVDRPVQKIKVSREIGPEQYQYIPIDNIISYTKGEMILEIAEEMREKGMIRYQVDKPLKPPPEKLFISDIFDGMYRITAEVWAARIQEPPKEEMKQDG